MDRAALLPVALVLVAALFLVGTLNPAVEWLERKRWPRGWGIGLVFTVMFVFTVLVMALTIPSLMGQSVRRQKKNRLCRGASRMYFRAPARPRRSGLPT